MAVRGPGWKALPQCTHMTGNDLVLLAGASRTALPVDAPQPPCTIGEQPRDRFRALGDRPPASTPSPAILTDSNAS